MAGQSKKWGLSVKQRNHVTPGPAPICESPGVTWPRRAGSPAHNSETNRRRCPPSFWFLRRRILGNQIGRADFLQQPAPQPFLTLAAPRERFPLHRRRGYLVFKAPGRPGH